MSVIIVIEQGMHQHPVPRGMQRLLQRLASAAGFEGTRVVQHGPADEGTAHTRGVSVGKIERRSRVELYCQPDNNDSMRLMWFLLQGAEDAEQVRQRLQKAAAGLQSHQSGSSQPAGERQAVDRTELRRQKRERRDAKRAAKKLRREQRARERAEAAHAGLDTAFPSSPSVRAQPQRPVHYGPAPTEQLKEFAQRKRRRGRKFRRFQPRPVPVVVTGPREVPMPRLKKKDVQTVGELVKNTQLRKEVMALLETVVDDQRQFVVNKELRSKLPYPLNEANQQKAGLYFYALHEHKYLRRIEKGRYELPGTTAAIVAVQKTAPPQRPLVLNRQTPIETLIELAKKLTPEKVRELREIDELERPHREALDALEARRGTARIGIPDESFRARVILAALQEESRAEHDKRQARIDLIERVLKGEVHSPSPSVAAAASAPEPAEAATDDMQLRLTETPYETAPASPAGAATAVPPPESSQSEDEHGPTPAMRIAFPRMETEATQASAAEPEAASPPVTSEQLANDGTEGD